MGLAPPILSDPVGIQTQDLQNRNLSFNFFEYPFVYGHLRHSSKTHLRRFCADSACYYSLVGCKGTKKRAKSQNNYGLFRVRVLRMSTNLEDCTVNLENFP